MIIKVLGTGCPNCKTLEQNTRMAAEVFPQSIEVVKVDDIVKILEYNVMRTPALVFDEQVVLTGKIATKNEIIELIKHHIS